jgi:hypothetical protein
MKVKLDENLDARLAAILRLSDHDATTVRDQGLGGIDDQALYVHCGSEERILVTLDRDFANVLRYPPKASGGLVVFRGPNDFLFYRGIAPRWLCAVVQRDDDAGFLITAYPTDAVKAGETIWTRSG